MEDYEIGALGDLISSSPGKGRSAQKLTNKSPYKSMKSISRKQNDRTGTINNGTLFSTLRKSGQPAQKRKSVTSLNTNAKKLKPVDEESSSDVHDDESDDELGEDGSDAKEEQASDELAESGSDVEEEEASDEEEIVDDELEEDVSDVEEEQAGDDELEEDGSDVEEEEASDEEKNVDDEGVSDKEENVGNDKDVEECVSAEESDDDLEEAEDVSVDEEDSEHVEEEEDDAASGQQSSKLKKVPETMKMFHDRTIFVGNVKACLTKKILIQNFKKYGAIESVRFRSIAVENPKLGKKLSIQKKKLHQQRSTCNAYIRFAKVASAERAVQEENGKEFHGFHLRVTNSDVGTISHDNMKTLFVGNLSFKAEDEALWKAFAPCGEINSVRIIRDKYTSVSKGFAYINFKSADSVQLALQMGDVTIDKRVLRLTTSEFKKKEKRVNPDNDCCVFVAGFSATTSKEAVTKAFQEIGPVAKVRLIRDKETKKPSGCGFVTFKNSKAAQNALNKAVRINGALIDVQVPRTTVNRSKYPPKNQVTKQGKAMKGKIDKPWKKKEGCKSTGGSPPRSFQGAKSKANDENKKIKVDRGQLMKKKIVKKIAPKNPKAIIKHFVSP